MKERLTDAVLFFSMGEEVIVYRRPLMGGLVADYATVDDGSVSFPRFVSCCRFFDQSLETRWDRTTRHDDFRVGNALELRASVLQIVTMWVIILGLSKRPNGMRRKRDTI
uniref:Uncharacterized protein n=1 Tax=Anopheles culicifacies TaxID=139723 RepID=A0A182MX91_9DIPT